MECWRLLFAVIVLVTCISWFNFTFAGTEEESEDRIWENCCQKANWHQSQLPISTQADLV